MSNHNNPKEALFYKKLKSKDGKNDVQCQMCPNFCHIPPGKRGSCRVRENQDGKLVTLVYGKLVTASIDPIEKKPFYHFLPGTKAYSIATAGCNLHCMFCQNWDISQQKPDEIPFYDSTPEKVVKKAIKAGCKTIAYTYVEPAVFYEFILDVAKLAKKKGLKNVMITNGYLNPEPIKELYQYIDAANIDIKGFNEEFYKKICSARLKPVLDAIQQIKDMGVWIELTNLIIPGENDDLKEIKRMCTWIKSNIGDQTPVHFSRFFPTYKMMHVQPTALKTLEQAQQIAKQTGLKHVYIGNVQEEKNTFCPECSETLINRDYLYNVKENKIKNGRCPKCHSEIRGVWN